MPGVLRRSICRCRSWPSSSRRSGIVASGSAASGGRPGTSAAALTSPAPRSSSSLPPTGASSPTATIEPSASNLPPPSSRSLPAATASSVDRSRSSPGSSASSPGPAPAGSSTAPSPHPAPASPRRLRQAANRIPRRQRHDHLARRSRLDLARRGLADVRTLPPGHAGDGVRDRQHEQDVHRGPYPQAGRGGPAAASIARSPRCSPTSGWGKPGRPIPGGVTVRMLLDHTSGLADFFFRPGRRQGAARRPGRDRSAERALAYTGGRARPGKEWHYSNTNYLLLGLIAERVTGTPFAEQGPRAVPRPAGPPARLRPGRRAGPWARLDVATTSTARRRTARPIALSDKVGRIVPFTSVVTCRRLGRRHRRPPTADLAAWGVGVCTAGSVLQPGTLATAVADVGWTAASIPLCPMAWGSRSPRSTATGRWATAAACLGDPRRAALPAGRRGVAIAVLENQNGLRRAAARRPVARRSSCRRSPSGRDPGPSGRGSACDGRGGRGRRCRRGRTPGSAWGTYRPVRLEALHHLERDRAS